MIKPHSLAYQYVAVEKRRLCRKIYALQEHRRRCKETNRESVAVNSISGRKAMAYTAQWTVILDEGGEK